MAAGDVRAIGDWFRGTRYLKDDVDELFLLNNTLTPYELTIKAPTGSEVTITGDTSERSYTIKMIGNEVKKLLFFNIGEDIEATDGVHTITKTLSNSRVDTINLIQI